jgi:hypothetical protein
MRDRLRGMLGLDAVVPVLLIAATALMILEPTFFGVAISERDIILGFFGFLGIDALVERTGRLSRIERQLETLAARSAGPMAANEILRPRSSFERMDVLVAKARHSLLIIGVNLEGALPCVSALLDLVRSGGTARLIAMDPDGAALGLTAAMAGIEPAIRRQKIIQNLELLRAELDTRLDTSARSRVSLMVTDRVLPIGAVGLDERARGGSLIVQHYLTATAAEFAPLMWLRPETDQPWFDRYLAQCERNEPLETADLTGACYDLVIMNGSLHYVRNKKRVLRRVLAVSAPDAVHAVAVFSTATPVPAEHAVVPVFPDEEGGVVERFYRDWARLLLAHERRRSEHSHPGFAPHVHSHIKLIAARFPGLAEQ